MKRFNTTKYGYRFDRLLFWFSMSLFLSLVFYLMWQYNFDFSAHVYFNCPGPNSCKNPLAKMDQVSQELKILWVIPLYKTDDYKQNCEWCKEEVLLPGEYGEKPPESFIFNNILLLTIGIFFLTFIANHYIHNKGKKFDIEIPITKNIILNKQSIKEFIKRTNERDEDENKDNSEE